MKINRFLKSLSMFLFLYQINYNLAYSEEKLRVAIMPFENLSKAIGDPQLETLTYGMSESLISGLCRLKNIILLERSQIQKILQEQTLSQTGIIDDSTAPKVGNILGANVLVLGSFQVIGAQIKLVARFVDTETGEIDKSKVVSIRGKWTDDVFDLQDELAKLFINSFNLSPSDNDLSEMTKIFKSTNSYTAYDFYLKGRNEFLKLNITGYKNAIINYNKALELDNNYTLALGALAEAYIFLGWDKRFRMLKLENEYETAFSYANKAISSNPNLSEAFRAQAVSCMGLKKSEQARSAAQRAIEINPNDADAYSVLAMTYPPKDCKQQVYFLKKAIQLQPKRAFFYYQCGEYMELYGRDAGFNLDSAFVYYKKAVELDSTLYKPRIGLGRYYQSSGKIEAAKRQYDVALKFIDADIQYLQAIASFYASIDSNDIAINLSKKIIDINNDYPGGHHLLAVIYEKQKNESEAKQEYKIAAVAYRNNISQTDLNLQKIKSLIQLGNIYLYNLNDPDQALNCFDEIEIFEIDNQTEVSIRYNIAVAYAFKKDIKKSLNALKGALQYGDKEKILTYAQKDPNLKDVTNHKDFSKLY